MKSHIRAVPGRLLIYGTDRQKTDLLRQICSGSGMQSVILTQNQLNETVGSLADKPMEDFSEKHMPAGVCGRDRECIIFCGFPEKAFDDALKSIRENIPGGIALKAVLTSSNRKMTLEQLISELEREHSRLQSK